MAGIVEQTKSRLKGTIVAMTTPIGEDDTVDYDGLARLTEFYVSNGIKALIAAGTTGYCYTLSEQEHVRVVQTIVQAAAGRAFVIAGVSHSGTMLANRLADACEKTGADVLLMTPPYYHQSCTYHGCLQHYRDVAKNHSLGLIVYNTAAANLDVDFFKRCADVETIVGVKDAGGNYPLGRDLLIELGERFAIVSGGSMVYYLWHHMWGSQAYVSSIANLVPEVEIRFYRHLEQGEMDAAMKIVTTLERPFFSVMDGEHNWHECLHAALKIFGLPANNLRLPLVEPPAAWQEKMKQQFVKIGLLK